MQLRPLSPDDDIEAELDLRRRAFGAVSAAQLPAWMSSIRTGIEAGATIGAFDGSRLVGSPDASVVARPVDADGRGLRREGGA